MTPIPPDVATTCDPAAIMEWCRDYQMPLDLKSTVMPLLKVKQKSCY